MIVRFLFLVCKGSNYSQNNQRKWLENHGVVGEYRHVGEYKVHFMK